MGQLDVNWILEGDTLTLGLKGKLNTLEAMNLDERLGNLPGEVKNIFFDLDGLYYIASAGLRILFWAGEYTAEKGGRISVRNVDPGVREMMEITGFGSYLSEAGDSTSER